MCTGRVDLTFVLRAFLKGADGVFIGGCWLGECHYVTEGNYDALANMLLCRKLMEMVGMNPQRLRLEWMSAAEGTRFAEVMDDFVKTLKGLGPLGEREGIDEKGLRRKLETIRKLVPYVKLVEREKLRVPAKSEEAYREFFDSDEVTSLFQALIADKLAIGQILSLLEEGPLPTSELSRILDLTPSEISRYMNSSSRQGLVRYDVERKCYALA